MKNRIREIQRLYFEYEFLLNCVELFLVYFICVLSLSCSLDLPHRPIKPPLGWTHLPFWLPWHVPILRHAYKCIIVVLVQKRNSDTNTYIFGTSKTRL